MQKNTQWKEELVLIASILDKTPLEKTIKWGAEVFTYNGNNPKINFVELASSVKE